MDIFFYKGIVLNLMFSVKFRLPFFMFILKLTRQKSTKT